MQIFVKTLKGLEEILYQELVDLGGEDVQLEKRGVSCYGNEEFLYKCNLCLRTALRVLVPIHECIVHTEKDFYRKMKKFDWNEYLDLNQTFAIDSVVHSTIFNHSKFIALRTKDAIVDQFREKFDERPSVDVKKADVRFNVHISDKKVIVSLDSSGFSLHKRGYRQEGHESPLNEVLAAGLVLMSGWRGETSFIDPMCGSGTILVEAGLIAKNRAPHIYSNDLGFTTWKSFNSELWERVKLESIANERSLNIEIRGGEILQDYVESAILSTRKMKLEHDIQIKHISLFDFTPNSSEGTVIMNPPYGERFKVDEINAFYKRIGDQLKTYFQGFSAWIISSNMEALKFVGLKPKRKIPMMNGALECKVHQYELYRGTKKVKE